MHNPQSAIRNPQCQGGQALLELAIFGSLFLMVLAVMVNYGLNADASQRAIMRAFRESLAGAGASSQNNMPKTVSYLLVQDKHIPNPSNPFGIGSVVPVSASVGGFARNNQADVRLDTELELPIIKVNIEGSKCPGSRLQAPDSEPPCTYLLAGFRMEKIQASSLERYKQVYGPLSVCDKPAAVSTCCNGEGCGDGCDLWEDGPPDPVTGELTQVCAKKTKIVRIIDLCEGEIIKRDACIRQARMILDPMVCEDLCNKGKAPGDRTDCHRVCQAEMNLPLYATAAEEDSATHVPGGAHRWSLFALDFFFASAGGRLGLQPGFAKITTTRNTLVKSENELAVSTTSSVDWTEQTTRQFKSKRYGGGPFGDILDEKTITSVQERKEPDKRRTENW